jgi:flagella basal body P-ring formation protein FlgA
LPVSCGVVPFSPFCWRSNRVSRAQVRNALAVERGAGVRATFRSAGIELTTQLVAVDAGAIGQTITLRNPSSNKLVRGRVVDSGAVVLE